MKVGELIDVLQKLEKNADVAVALDYQNDNDLGVHDIVQIDKFVLDNGDVAVVLIVDITDSADPGPVKHGSSTPPVPPAANKN
jgi:hypothetical protein